MKRSRFSDEQIIAILKEQEAGMPTRRFAVITRSALQHFTNENRNMSVLRFLRPNGFGR